MLSKIMIVAAVATAEGKSRRALLAQRRALRSQRLRALAWNDRTDKYGHYHMSGRGSYDPALDQALNTGTYYGQSTDNFAGLVGGENRALRSQRLLGMAVTNNDWDDARNSASYYHMNTNDWQSGADKADSSATRYAGTTKASDVGWSGSWAGHVVGPSAFRTNQLLG